MVNDTIFLLIGITIIIAVVYLVFHIEKKKNMQYAAFFKGQARKRNGHIIQPDTFSPPHLLFTYQDIQITVYLTPMKSGRIAKIPPSTFINANFPQTIDCEFQIYIQGNAERVIKPIPYPYVKLQSNDFDEVYTIRSNDMNFVGSIFTFDVQDKLLKVKEFNPVLEFSKNRLSLTLPFLTLDEGIFDENVNATKEIIGRIKDIGENQ